MGRRFIPLTITALGLIALTVGVGLYDYRLGLILGGLLAAVVGFLFIDLPDSEREHE